jgi:hypothetical protein
MTNRLGLSLRRGSSALLVTDFLAYKQTKDIHCRKDSTPLGSYYFKHTGEVITTPVYSILCFKKSLIQVNMDPSFKGSCIP